VSQEGDNSIDQDYLPPVAAGDLLWRPTGERVANAGSTAFRHWVNERYGESLADYWALHRWSVEDIARFWEAVWIYYDVAPGQRYEQVLSSTGMPGAQWFTGTRLNYAEYLLRQGERADLARPAVIAESESVEPRSINWEELRQQVASLASYLREAGVQPGDRVCAYLPISVESVVAMLAAAAVGAVWSSCSPDFGAKGVLERFEQIKPRLLFAISHYRYNGKDFDRSEELATIVEALPSLEEMIYLPWADDANPAPPELAGDCKLTMWQASLDAVDIDYAGFIFEPMPFDAPLWIMYSSGTTGAPKGIVHQSGGVLLESVKYAWLQDDMNPQSVKFFVTTTGWTMFNILLGGMTAGAAVVLYDGSPAFPDKNRLWDLCDRYRITYFGASPTYVNGLVQTHYSPRESHDLSSVKTIALTGSPSAPETFAWFYRHVHDDLLILSMSGGTDVCTAFIAGAPELPVYAGEIQGPCLGVDVGVFDDAGEPLPAETDGELVIRQPIPSMPLCFWNDESGERYRDAYFADFPGIWRQGDLTRETAQRGYVISGRSDSTLNRFGIRIGTAEIYRVIESLDEVKDSLIISVELPGANFYMPLFLVLADGVELSDELTKRIVKKLSSECSPRHVPDEVHTIEEVPYTLTGKKLEVPVKKLLLGVPADKALNKGAVANIAAMDFFIEFARSLQEST
jgi:acetoacetyl-CoA synthetase